MRHEPRIVRIDQGDTERVIALHRRCSAHTLWSRYHGAMGDPGSYLGALLSRRGSVHLAVRAPSGRLVAVGHLMPDNGNAEAALLVEDAWQNKGLGTRLLDCLGRSAVKQGWGEVYGLILPDERMTAMLRWSISETVEWGDYVTGPRIITDATKADEADTRRDPGRDLRP